MGFIWADDPEDRLVPAAERLQALRVFANQATTALYAAEQFEQMRFLADHDPLTNLLNRRSFVQHLDAEVARSRRYTRPLALVIFDLDELKTVNDTQGHAAGDEAIKRVADVLRATIRTGDNAFRIGGDEFAVILPEANERKAEAAAQRIAASLGPDDAVAVVGLCGAVAAGLAPGDVVVADEVRDVLAGCGLSETISYSFIHPEVNAIFSSEPPIGITNALTENLSSMRLSLLPGLLENVVFNRAYGNRDGALFEAGRTYHRAANGVHEHARAALVMYGTLGTFWGDPKRPVDFFDAKGIVEQIAARMHIELEFATGDQPYLRKGKRAIARHGDREIASVGFLAAEVLQRFGIKGDVVAAEIDVEALLAATGAWTMAPVARYPGVPMILALTHGRDLAYQRIVDAIRSFDVPYLQEVGLRDRYAPDGDEIKTTLGMWYQAFDRSLTQDEVSALQQQLASRLAGMLPVRLL
jgi:diguanylate cyclase (GGDEF)-like protein